MIGERIKNRRIELGLSQGELAKILGYKSRSTINKIEKGINDITQSKVVAFARALNTTVSYLMGWDDTPQLSNKKQELFNAIDDMTEEQASNLLTFVQSLTGKQE